MGQAREVVRTEVARQLVGRWVHEADAPLRQIAAQARLLLGDAKQSTRRDVMVPRINGLIEQVKRLDVFTGTVAWWNRLNWGEPVATTPSEVLAADLLGVVQSRLAARLRERNNSLQIGDEGAWLFVDADRLEATLVGILTHACEAVHGSPIEVRLRRLSAASTRGEPVMEFLVLDAGPALTPEMQEMVNKPFGGCRPPSLDTFTDVGGFPLGLIVAHALARTLGGRVDFESDPAGRLTIRLRVPTRQTGSTFEAGAVGEGAPYEETVAGWRLGRQASATERVLVNA
jgi:signal transduction histidine kinase